MPTDEYSLIAPFVNDHISSKNSTRFTKNTQSIAIHTAPSPQTRKKSPASSLMGQLSLTDWPARIAGVFPSKLRGLLDEGLKQKQHVVYFQLTHQKLFKIHFSDIV